MDRVLVLIPARNEAETIGGLVNVMYGFGDVLVVVNPSTDGTAEEAEAAGATVVKNDRDENVGGSLLKGYWWALHRPYDLVLQIDAGGSHCASDAPKLLVAPKASDLVIGSRFAEGAAFVQKSARKALSRAGVVAGAMATGLWWDHADWTSGYRRYSRLALEFLVNARISERGHAFNWMAAVRLVQAGFVPSFVPIRYEASKSSASFKSLWEAAWAFLVAINR